MERTELIQAISSLSDGELKSILAERKARRRPQAGSEVVVIENHDSNGGTREHNLKFMSKAYNHKVRLVHELEKAPGWYITDFFQPRFIDIKNDYIHYGFLVVGDGDIRLVP